MSLPLQAPSLLVNCGVQLLLSLSVQVRSPVALELSQVQALYLNAHTISTDVKVRRLSDLMILPQYNVLTCSWECLQVPHENAHKLTSRRSSQVRRLLLRALVNFLLLPWPSFIVDHRVETRRCHLTSFVASFTAPARKLDVAKLAEDKALQEESE